MARLRPARVGILLALGAVVWVVWPAAAQRQSTFTGNVERRDTEGVRNYSLMFEAGARTYWHVHTEDQIIVALEGRGRFQAEGGEIQPIVPGQPVHGPGGVPHWHGADPDQHYVQLTMSRGTLEWLQPVTDEEYLGKKK